MTQSIVASRLGQLRGFHSKTGWIGWDEVSVLIPGAEMDGLITELRSQTLGVGSYTATFHLLDLLSGREAEQAIAARAAAKGLRTVGRRHATSPSGNPSTSFAASLHAKGASP